MVFGGVGIAEAPNAQATRLHAVAAAKKKAAAKARLVAEEESDAQMLRTQGIVLPEKSDSGGDIGREGFREATKKIDNGGGFGGGGAVGAITLTEIDDEDTSTSHALSPSARGCGLSLTTNGAAGEERDYTHWAKKRLAELVREGGVEHCEHRWYLSTTGGGGGTVAGSNPGRGAGSASSNGGRPRQSPLEAGSVRLTRMLEDRFDGHAIVKTKAGRRALYYELDVSCEWLGRHEATVGIFFLRRALRSESVEIAQFESASTHEGSLNPPQPSDPTEANALSLLLLFL